MKQHEIFLNVNIVDWVFGTIRKVQTGISWNDAWQQTYREIGGKSAESGKKACPMNGARTLYEMGRIKHSNKPRLNLPFDEVAKNYSKNGVYTLLALEILSGNPNISLKNLWKLVQQRFEEELNLQPAKSEQGSTKIAYKLWHLGKIVS